MLESSAQIAYSLCFLLVLKSAQKDWNIDHPGRYKFFNYLEGQRIWRKDVSDRSSRGISNGLLQVCHS
jgi:hypothetical protein